MINLNTLHDLWEMMAGYQEQPAVISLTPKGMETLTFAALLHRSEEAGAHLSGGGLDAGQRAVLWGPGSADWIIACLGILRAGGVVVPLDVQLGKEALERILADCDPSFILTSESQQERLRELRRNLPEVLLYDRSEGDSSIRSLPLSQRALSPDPRKPESVAVIFYTSGTTGPPKGVPLSHANLVTQIEQIMATDLLRAGDRLLLPLPQHHVYPFALGTLVPLASGVPIIFPQSLTGPQVLRALKQGEATVIAGVPRLYRALFEAVEGRFARLGPSGRRVFRGLLAAGKWPGLRGTRGWRMLLTPLHRRIGPKLRLLACGGSPLDPSLTRDLEALGWDIAIGYGLTETSPLLTINTPGSRRPESVGKSLPGVEIRLTDVGKGESGREVQVKGSNIFAGYWNLPEETEKVFTRDGWFRTGDLGRFDDDGYLILMGRASTLIVTESGKNVRPEEVEEDYEKSPAIREIGIFERKGRLAALIVPEDMEGGEQAVRKALDERGEGMPTHHRLAEFALTRTALPRTRLGKIRRHLLADLYQEVREGKQAEREEPMPLEEMSGEDRTLLQSGAARDAWQLLADRFPNQGLTPDSHLQQDLGIDSLEWLSLTVEINGRTGVELSEDTISRLRTVRDLLQQMAERESEGRKEVIAGDYLENPEEVLTAAQLQWLTPLPQPMLWISDLLFALNRCLMRLYFRLQVEGRENLPDKGPLVLAPNHLSSLDPLIIAAALDRKHLHETYWAGWAGIMFHNAVARSISRLGRAFPVDPQRAVVSSLAFGALVLRRRRTLVWFPEGERSRTGEMQSFRPGLGLLLRHYPVPVLPTLIRGSYKALPRGTWIPRRKPLRLVFGKTCDVNQLMEESEGKTEPERLVRSLQKRVNALEGNN
ncbi:MAG: AMP-binding protein [Syntrophotaleaceae bacterium]